MADHYVTITGFNHYYDLIPFKISNLIRCSKEPDNQYDGEAIRCSLPQIGTVGYLANSPSTLAGGTRSAGRVYDHVPDKFYVRVCFTTRTKVICRIEESLSPQQLDAELAAQLRKEDDWTD